MPPKKPQTSAKELLSSLAKGLRTSAISPNIYGYCPHDKQIRFHSAIVHGRLFIGGNRSGKTVGGATEAIWWLTHTHPYRTLPDRPIRGRAVGVDFINGIDKIVKPEIARWMPASYLRGGSWSMAYDRESRTLHMADGGFLEFMSYDQDLEKFAGTSRDFVWFDEEPPQMIFTENKLRLLDTGGCWWMTMTPVEGMSWTYDDIYVAARIDPNLFVVEVDTTENPTLNLGEIDVIMSGLSEDERKARIHGRYVQLGGLIYKQFGNHNIIEPMIPPKEWMHIASMDHGFNNPTAWLWTGVDRDGRIIVYDEHYESDQVVAYHAGRVKQLNREHGREPDYYVGDPSIRNVDPITGTSVQIEYIEHGVPIVLGNNDVRAGINRVATILGGNGVRPQLYIARNCVNLIYELQHYRWGTWAIKKMQFDKNKKEEPHKKNDHACDALRYMISSRPQFDDGTVVPEREIPVGASVAADPYTRIDEALVPSGRRRRSGGDYNLGEDY